MTTHGLVMLAIVCGCQRVAARGVWPRFARRCAMRRSDSPRRRSCWASRTVGLLAWLGLDVVAVASEPPPVGGLTADPLVPRALYSHGGLGTRFDRETFVLGERVDDAAHEQPFGRVGVPAPIDGSNCRAKFLARCSTRTAM